jgi:hypothetical protein
MKKIVIALFSLLIVILILPLLLHWSGFFFVDRPVASNKLLIEGWLNRRLLDEAPFNYNSYDTIFIVGVRTPDKWNKVEEIRSKPSPQVYKGSMEIPWEGFVFLRDYNRKVFSDTIKTVKLVASGTKGKGTYAHFSLLLKDSLLAQTYVNENKDTFTFQANLKPRDLKFLSVYFDNDYLTPKNNPEKEDINLTVYKVLLDTVSFDPSKNELFFINSYKSALINSSAVSTKLFLEAFKSIRSKIIVVDTLFTKRNRTLATARCFAEYIKKNNIEISSINIYTANVHSRRTNLAYRKVLGKEVKIGSLIKTCPECIYVDKKSFRKLYFHCLDETFSWFITIFS